ncbi:Major Facilitator Superfamily protein [compost metagenome]
MRIFLATPRLRGLLALNLTVAAASAMVIINTVVLVQSRFALPQSSTALALAAFGGGSMIAALVLPRLLKNIKDRTAMLFGGGILVAGLAVGINLTTYEFLLPLWMVLGVGYSLAQTPSGRLLRRSAHAEDRPALFAAQFALSHACWLITYPLAGWLGANISLTASFVGLAVVAGSALAVSIMIWRPAYDQESIKHTHANLPDDHTHLDEHGSADHEHPYVIDDQHRRWPSK